MGGQTSSPEPNIYTQPNLARHIYLIFTGLMFSELPKIFHAIFKIIFFLLAFNPPPYWKYPHSHSPLPPKSKQLLIQVLGHTDFFHFMRRFWYHVFTWTWESPRDSARSILSGVDRYFWVSNRFSSPISWSSVKTVRLRRHFLGRRNAEASPGERDRM